MKTTIDKQQPNVSVGIVSAKHVNFTLNGAYLVDGNKFIGNQSVELVEGKISFCGNFYNELVFHPQSAAASFSLYNVTIGIDFHWERQETQTFLDALKFIVDGDKLWAINELPIETYLESVISSEMSATASVELLKAHAVISRSWLLYQIKQKDKFVSKEAGKTYYIETDDEQIRWYDSEAHTLFDVCADDHCQRYQGITKETSTKATEAIRATIGQVLMYGGNICDARFSKCCGGISEEYQYCWENSLKPYLTAVRDDNENDITAVLPDLTCDDGADRWMRSTPQAFCNTQDKHILNEVLNDYDRETTDFYRWRITYTQTELSALISSKLGMNLGVVLDLIPMERGKSGRISKLKIVGSRRSISIGKELEIRKTLSPTHLYSSAFVVDKDNIINGVPQHFTIIGAGWGHGVGLCQIGAAVMGERGFDYRNILLHYYNYAEIRQIYK